MKGGEGWWDEEACKDLFGLSICADIMSALCLLLKFNHFHIPTVKMLWEGGAEPFSLFLSLSLSLSPLPFILLSPFCSTPVLSLSLSLSNPRVSPGMDMESASSVVLQALTQATSQDTALLKPAEEQLRQWETQPGFYSVLLVCLTHAHAHTGKHTHTRAHTSKHRHQRLYWSLPHIIH